MAYIPVPIVAEPSDIAEDAFAYIEEKVPGWLPSPGNLEAWLVEALAQFAGELRDLGELDGQAQIATDRHRAPPRIGSRRPRRALVLRRPARQTALHAWKMHLKQYIAGAVLFLLSDAARMITGEVIRVDAGQYISDFLQRKSGSRVATAMLAKRG